MTLVFHVDLVCFFRGNIQIILRGTETAAKPPVAIKPAHEHNHEKSVLVEGVRGMIRFCSSRTTSVFVVVAVVVVVVVVVVVLLLLLRLLAVVVVVLAVVGVQCSTDRVFSPSTDD